MKVNAESCKKWIPTFGAFMLLIQVGINIGWPSPNLVKLMEPNSTIPITASQASWVISSARLGGFAGAIVALIFIAFVGSKKTILLTLAIISTSWACLIIANSVDWLYTARFLSGLTQSTTFSSFPLYLGEVSPPKVRGALMCLSMVGLPVGVFFGTIAESYLSMKISSSIYLALCWISLIIFIWLPDSPYHLVKIGDHERARKSINWYFSNCDVDKELDEIRNFVEANIGQSIKEQLYEFNSPHIRKSLFVLLTLYILTELCGMVNLLAYMETILIHAKCDFVSPKVFVIFASSSGIFTIGFTMKLIEKCGRRFLMMISSIGTTLGMVGLATHFCLLDANVDPVVIQWLPFISIMLFLMTFTIGYGCVPHTVLSELFPDNAKNVAAFLATLISSIFGFVITKAYQPMVDFMGEAFVFWIHAGFSIMAVPCIVFMMPETKGKTLLEIQNLLVKKKDTLPVETNIPYLNKVEMTTEL